MLSRLSKHKHDRSRHRYDKLKPNQIRLLQLLPGVRTDRVVCMLRIVDLLAYDDIQATASIDGLERFEAISYVWGEAGRTTEIECDGRRMHVSMNLADVLRALRHRSSVRILWADALCINQRDHYERAQQVKLMGLIYWKAHRVLVWLGLEDQAEEITGAKQAIRVIKDLAAARRAAFGSTIEEHEAFRSVMFPEPGNITEDEWIALHHLLDRPWFGRVWVVQELGVARDAEFHCGEHYFTRTELQDFQSVLGQSRVRVAAEHNFSSQMLRLGDDYWRSCWGNTRLELGSDPKEAETFLDILAGARGLSCTDPRDSVYAFLGHPSAFKRQSLDIEPYHWYPRNYYSGRTTIVAPNYRKSNTCLKIYHELATTAIAKVGLGLNVLSHVAHTNETIRLDFPSWVPRWNVEGPTYSIGCEVYFAASGTDLRTCFELSSTKCTNALNQLSFEAWRLDTIRCVRRVRVMDDLVECLDRMALLLSDAPKMGRSSAIPIPSLLTYPYEEPFVLAFASTITGGLTSSWQSPCEPADERPDQVVRNFHAYYRHQHSLESSDCSDPALDHARYFARSFWSAASRRLLFITHDGRLGLGPPITEGSDQLWIPIGAKMPVLLRPCGKARYKVIGQAYVYGVMRGEAAKGKSKADAQRIYCI